MDKIILTATQVEPCHYSVVVSVPAGRVARTLREVQGQFRQYAQVPGFRAGLAPDKLLKMRFGKQIQKEARDSLVRTGFEELLKSEHKPVSMPTFVKEKEGEVVEGKAFEFAVEYDVKPDFEPPTYKGVALRRTKFTVTDEEVNQVLNDMARQRTSWAKVERPAAAGDTVKVSFKAELPEGTEVPEPAKRLLQAEETWLQLQEPELIPGVTAQLVGQAAGAELAFQVSFAEGYHEPSLVGKSAQYSFKLLEVHGSIVPPVDDELAKQMGVENLEKLREALRGSLEGRYEQMAQNHLRGQVSETLMQGFSCELPPRLLAAEVSQAIQEQMQRDQGRQDRPMPTNEEEFKARLEEYQKTGSEMATQRLRYRLLVEKIAELEKLTVSQDDIERTLEAYISQRGMTLEQFEKEHDPQAVRARLHDALLRDRVEQFVIEQAQVTEVDAAALAAENAAKAAADKPADAPTEPAALNAEPAADKPADGAAPAQA